MKFTYDDGGRQAAGYRGHTGDCVVRAIAIATGLPYQEVYDGINALATHERTGRRKRGVSNARLGVYKDTYKRFLLASGWRWVPTMHIGSGCRVHLTDDELPAGRLVVALSKHLTAVIDGVIHDTHDPQREPQAIIGPRIIVDPVDGGPRNEIIGWTGRRCVYGYFTEPA